MQVGKYNLEYGYIIALHRIQACAKKNWPVLPFLLDGNIAHLCALGLARPTTMLAGYELTVEGDKVLNAVCLLRALENQ